MTGSPEPGVDEPAATERPPTDEVLDLLCHRERRVVLRTLIERSDPVEVDTLARRLDRTVAGGAPAGAGTVPERALIRLHHVHLPKLADAGALRYDADDGVVTATDDVDTFRPFLDTAPAGQTGSEIPTE